MWSPVVQALSVLELIFIKLRFNKIRHVFDNQLINKNDILELSLLKWIIYIIDIYRIEIWLNIFDIWIKLNIR